MGKVEQDLGLPPYPALQGSAAHQRGPSLELPLNLALSYSCW